MRPSGYSDGSSIARSKAMKPPDGVRTASVV